MKRYLTKRNLYIGLFVILYLLVGIVSLFHSFAFFGLANGNIMSVMLGCCFEIGQVAVLMSLLTSKKEQGRVMPWILMFILTTVQILGNVFSSYKYMMEHSIKDLIFFKNPIFIWTDLPDDITTVIVTWLLGSLLPIIALCMTSMVSNYIMDTDPDDNKQLSIENDTIENEHVEDMPTEAEDEPEDSEGTEQEPQEQENNPVRNEEQEEVDRRVEEESKEDDEEAMDDTHAEEDKQDESRTDEAQPQNIDVLKHIEEKDGPKQQPHFVNLK